jgi:hypothetical protein
MNYRLLISLILILTAACQKEDGVEKKSAAELLTQKKWVLIALGFDDNRNNILDSAENTIQDCQKDNSYEFKPSGTGEAADNALSCGVPPSSPFTWKLANGNEEIEIINERMIIHRLTEEELILQPVIPGLDVNFMMIYRH